MILHDTHLHSSFSSDSDTPMEDMVREGIRLGMDTLCFTEHFDPCFPDTPDGLDFQLDFPGYRETLFSLKEKYQGEIEILYGLELGVQPHIKKATDQFYEEYGEEFDFIINSCHIVDGMDPYYGDYFKKHGTRGGLKLYFESILENLTVFPHYQTVGHLDYACRYLPADAEAFAYADYADILDAILLKIIEEGKALEVNAAGLKYGLAWPNPHIDILKRYRALGGELITIGSDGHKPEHMAWDFGRLPGILAQAGFSHYVVFRDKTPSFYEI